MKKFLLSLIFKKLKVDHVVATLTKALADLKTVAEQHTAEAEEHQNKIAELHFKSHVAVQESARANRIHTKISELLK